MLAGFVIITAMLTIGFAFPAFTAGDRLTIWDVLFVMSAATFLFLFVRLLLERARLGIQRDEQNPAR